MGLIDEALMSDEENDPTAGLSNESLIRGVQKPAGRMTAPGVMSAPNARRDSAEEINKFQPQVSMQLLARTLQQLRNVPDALKAQVLTKMLGIPFNNPKDEDLERQKQLARFRHELGAGERQENRDMHQETRQAQDEARKDRMTNARYALKDNLQKDIMMFTAALDKVSDPQQKAKLTKLLYDKHKDLQKFEDMEKKLQDKQMKDAGIDPSSGTGSSARQPAQPSQFGQFLSSGSWSEDSGRRGEDLMSGILGGE